MENRKAFNFYRSYYETGLLLDNEDRIEYYDAILHYQFTGEKKEPKREKARLLFRGQIHSLEKQVIGYTKGIQTYPTGNPTKGSNKGKYKGSYKEEKEQEKEEDKVYKENAFKVFWKYYNKGSKKLSEERFMKLTREDLAKIQKHLPLYFQSTPEIKYRKDAERYLSNRLWENENDDTLKAMQKSVELPDKWWSADLTPEQQKMLTPDQLKNWKKNRTRIAIGA